MFGKGRISAGSLVFESDPAAPYWRYELTVHPSYYPGSYWSWFTISTAGYKPLTNGASVDDLLIEFQDSSGYTPSSEYLPTGAPDLQKFSQKSITVFGTSAAGSYQVVFDIDSASTMPPPEGGLIVSPATGSFSRLQRFDAALLLPPGSEIRSMQANVGGVPAPFSYPDSCSFVPPNSRGQPAIICPDAPWRLPDGTNHIEWHVELTNGTMLNKTVDWELIP